MRSEPHSGAARAGLDPGAAAAGPGRLPSVLFIVPEMLPVPPTQGGAVEHWVHELSQGLARRHFEVGVVSRPAEPAPPAGPVTYLGVPWTRAGRWLLRLKQTSSRRNPLRALAKLAGVLGYALGVRRRLREHPADILYVHNDPLLAWLIGKRPGQQLVLHMHNDHLSVPRLLRPWLAQALRPVDRVLCVSDYIRRRACLALPDLAPRLVTVLNATDPGFFCRSAAPAGPAPAPFQLLYVGRLTEDKGVHVLIEAFARLLADAPQARLVIAGSSFFADAPQTDYQRRLARQAAPLKEAITFTGFVPHERLRQLYAQAQVVVVPSLWQEPFGLVVVEAMASETCVLASRVGGIPELIAHESTGLLLPPGDATALAQAMARVLRDAEWRQQLARSARRSVLRRFAYPRLVAEIADGFTALARAPQSAPGR